MTVRVPIRLRLAAVLSACVVLLAACGSSGTGLIPAGNASSLQSAFDKLNSDVQAGTCNAIAGDLSQASTDLAALPATVDPALRQRLSQGLSDLQQRALTQCRQSSSSSSSSSTSTSSSSSTSSSTPTTTTTSTTTSTTSTPPSSSTSTSSTSSSATNPGGVAAPGGAGGAQGGAGVNGQ